MVLKHLAHWIWTFKNECREYGVCRAGILNISGRRFFGGDMLVRDVEFVDMKHNKYCVMFFVLHSVQFPCGGIFLLFFFTLFPTFFCPWGKYINCPFKVSVPRHTLGMPADRTRAYPPTQPDLEPRFVLHHLHKPLHTQASFKRTQRELVIATLLKLSQTPAPPTI